MIKVSTQQLKSGMVAAKPVVTKHGQQICPARTTLTSQLIARLAFYKITSVVVTKESYDRCNASSPFGSADTSADSTPELLDDLPELLDDIPEPPASAPVPPTPEAPAPKTPAPAPKAAPQQKKAYEVPNRTYNQKMRSTPQFQAFQTAYSRNFMNLKNCFEKIIAGTVTDEDFDALLKEASDMFASKTSLEIFDMVHTLRSLDDTVYAHSLNVALIARAIGKWLRFSKADLDTLTLAGLLHDIGKTQIPDEVLTKQGKLTDEEFALIKSHPQLGHKLLKQTKVDTRVKLAALQHHERSDGSGYPRGLQDDEIDEFASIIAIADVYDAMTAARAYRAPLCVFQVISAFEQDGFQKYNPNVIFTFLKRVANCYNNSRIMLSNGVSGYIVFLNDKKLSRPIIKTDDGQMIDLCAPENSELYIKSTL